MFALRSWRLFLLSCLLASSWSIPLTDTAKDLNALRTSRILDDKKGQKDEVSVGDQEVDEDVNTGGGDGDSCAKAENCKDCEDASSQLTEDTEVCQWSLGTSDTLECVKKKKSEVEDMLGDMCSGSGAEGSENDGSKSPADSAGEPTSSPPSKAPTRDSALSYPEEEEGNGTILAIVLLLVFVGIAYSNRDKMFKVLKAADGFDGMGGGGETTPKPAKYHDVPGDDEDEEWGWGDDKDSTSGNIELPATESTGSIGSYKDEVVHKRNTSIDIKDPVSYGNKTASPLGSSSRPVAPAPSSGGLTLPSSTTNKRSSSSGSAAPVKSGMSLMSKQQKAKPKPAANPPASAPIPIMSSPATAQPMPTSAAVPIPQRITSLGKKKPVAPAKPKRTTKPPEDDIFASMGLSAKPKFSAPVSGGPKSAPAASSSSGSRWVMSANTAATGTTLSANFSDDGGEDDDWGDDDDLNDLLDE